MGRPRKSIDQHQLDGTLYQHKYYMARKATSQDPQPADPALVKQAEEHRELWVYGYDRHDLLADEDRARVLWEAVRGQYMIWFPVGAVDHFGAVNYGPWGWWAYDCPAAPFVFEVIEGLPPGRSREYWQHQALIEWGKLPPGTPAQGLIAKAAECERLFQRKMSGNDNYLPWPTGTPRERMLQAWEGLKAEREAWVKLGYIQDG